MFRSTPPACQNRARSTDFETQSGIVGIAGVQAVEKYELRMNSPISNAGFCPECVLLKINFCSEAGAIEQL